MNPSVTLFLSMIAGWMNRKQQTVIDYAVEENRVSKAQLQGAVHCVEHLGSLLKFYRRGAAQDEFQIMDWDPTRLEIRLGSFWNSTGSGAEREVFGWQWGYGFYNALSNH